MQRVALAGGSPDADQNAVGIANRKLVRPPWLTMRRTLFDDDAPDPIGHGIDILTIKIESMGIAVGNDPTWFRGPQCYLPALAVRQNAKACVAPGDCKA